MYVRIVNFALCGLSGQDYARHTEQVAEVVRTWPGLLAKIWLADAGANIYGGVYLFDSRVSADASRATEVFTGMLANPHFTQVTVTEFDVLEAPTAITASALAGSGIALR